MEKNDAKGWADDRLASLRPPAEWAADPAQGLFLLQEKRAAYALRARQRIWVGGALMAACIGVLAFPVTRAFAQHCVDACVGETTRVSGLFSRHASRTEAGNRRMAPDFTLSDASGRTVKLSDYRGQVVLLNFWATWCSPCKVEIPWFVEFQRTYQNRNFTVLGVSFDDDGWKAVKPYIQAKNVDYPVMVGDDNVSMAYGGIESLPTTMLIDKEGRIAVKHVGLCAKNDYEAEIKNLLEEKVQ